MAAEVPTISFTVTGPLRSKSNHRTGKRSDWSRQRAFETYVSDVLRALLPSDWVRPGIEAASVGDRPVVVASIWAATLIDAGNLTKSVLDAGEGLLYRNDAEVCATSQFVQRTRLDQRFAVAFAQLPRGADLRRSSQVLQTISEWVIP